jgi:hypothetical protein
MQAMYIRNASQLMLLGKQSLFVVRTIRNTPKTVTQNAEFMNVTVEQSL